MTTEQKAEDTKINGETDPGEEKPRPEYIDPKTIIIDGDASKLIKVVKDNPDLKEGRIDIGTLFGWQPVNYKREESK